MAWVQVVEKPGLVPLMYFDRIDRGNICSKHRALPHFVVEAAVSQPTIVRSHDAGD